MSPRALSSFFSRSVSRLYSSPPPQARCLISLWCGGSARFNTVARKMYFVFQTLNSFIRSSYNLKLLDKHLRNWRKYSSKGILLLRGRSRRTWGRRH
ncbi:uncharacterized protein BT62DRAFT_411495 [Guyanagaster necrorhizus]|uniref:Uncharacterized protein n=1 Tax=Guyanagaster necrorhizus TaxID=856835 RepID=A0A9P7W3G3_9AGAR|nr:uncharacterized protein BT62DRAFT_411495 [Guyanagaster necrorhizus MCA 3950]KAG7451275.1 hypothetical protein BT62DRAFT_411495 [Guyanagaster necrorhizus MCA 3950]